MYILGKDYMYIVIYTCRNIHQSYKFNIQFLVNGKLNYWTMYDKNIRLYLIFNF